MFHIQLIQKKSTMKYLTKLINLCITFFHLTKYAQLSSFQWLRRYFNFYIYNITERKSSGGINLLKNLKMSLYKSYEEKERDIKVLNSRNIYVTYT